LAKGLILKTETEAVRPQQTSPRFVTLRKDQEPARLRAYLRGDARELLERHAIAMPVTTLKAGALRAETAEWTFEVVPLADLQRDPWWRRTLRALRPESWVLSLAPVLTMLGWLAASSSEPMNLSRALAAVIGVIALHAAMNLFGDYHDHMRGWDRVPERGADRVLARGDFRGFEILRVAWASAGLAAICGGALLIANFDQITWKAVLLLLMVLAVVLEFGVSRWGLKYRGFGELAAWFFFGPWLTGGLSWALTGRIPWSAWVMGLPFGSMALLILHLRNFERIMIDSQAGLGTWPARTGFEASKKFTWFCATALMGSLAALLVFADPSPERSLPVLVTSMGLGPLLGVVRAVRSPSGGELHGLAHRGLRLAWAMALSFWCSDLLRLWGSATLARIFS
jgi:1,4-dihydroxy-2-naphthoate octaprenyltransferase